MRQTIKSLAREIKETWPWVDVKVESSWSSTDRKIAGTRLRHPGKGRRGSRITVSERGVIVFDHDNSETYRTTAEVRQWFEEVKAGVVLPSRGERWIPTELVDPVWCPRCKSGAWLQKVHGINVCRGCDRSVPQVEKQWRP